MRSIKDLKSKFVQLKQEDTAPHLDEIQVAALDKVIGGMDPGGAPPSLEGGGRGSMRASYHR